MPRGDTLPDAMWARRHRWLLALAWAHVPVLLLIAVLAGYPLYHGMVDVAPVVMLAALATWTYPERRWRAAACCLSLLTSSAVVVHLWHGQTEAHFHFFVVVTLCALYEEWVPYGLAFLYVVLHHTVMGVISPQAVYGHGGSPLLWAGVHGGFILALGAANTITWRLNEDARAEALQASAEFRSAFDDAPTGMVLTTLDGRIERVNATFLSVTGHNDEDLTGTRLADVASSLRHGSDEVTFIRADGSTGWALWRQSVVRDGDGHPNALVTHMLDISVRKEIESQLDHQAHHDELTGLPNRALFSEKLGDALDAGPTAVLFVDLDEFKIVNDSLGHSAGDELLVIVGGRLRHALRPGDTIARFGGDEFAILLPGVDDEDLAAEVADRIAAALGAPITVEGQERYVTASVGVRCAAAGELSSEEMLRDADAAMYRAKALGKDRAERFDTALRTEVQQRMELEGDLRRAVARDQLRLVYQPQFDLRTGEIIGTEALLRWDHPRLGVVPPLAFVPIAERNGLIGPIGAWALHEACVQACAWSGVEMAVNVSPRQLADPAFPDLVEGILRETGLDPQRLCLEVTESTLIADPETTQRALVALKGLGVRLAIDDFGVGQSSLGQLRTILPIDTLKIDRSFVEGLGRSSEGTAIFDAVVQLARSLGLRALAEGVETPAQADALRGMACSVAQGYHFARPVGPAEIERLLEAPADLAA